MHQATLLAFLALPLLGSCSGQENGPDAPTGPSTPEAPAASTAQATPPAPEASQPVPAQAPPAVGFDDVTYG